MKQGRIGMRFLNPATRILLVPVLFFLLLTCIFWSWVFMRFLHYEAQYRSLAPEHYNVDVVTAEDYRLLADPENREVTLSDGTTIRKAPIWDDVILPKYKPVRNGTHYVLVRTKGTAHFLPYVSGYFLMFGFLAACGLAVSLWNLRLDGDSKAHPPDSYE
jgi:hypothetical protein